MLRIKRTVSASRIVVVSWQFFKFRQVINAGRPKNCSQLTKGPSGFKFFQSSGPANQPVAGITSENSKLLGQSGTSPFQRALINIHRGRRVARVRIMPHNFDIYVALLSQNASNSRV